MAEFDCPVRQNLTEMLNNYISNIDVSGIAKIEIYN